MEAFSGSVHLPLFWLIVLWASNSRGGCSSADSRSLLWVFKPRTICFISLAWKWLQVLLVKIKLKYFIINDCNWMQTCLSCLLSVAKTIIGLVSGHSVEKETVTTATKPRRGRRKLYKTEASSPLLDSPHMVRQVAIFIRLQQRQVWSCLCQCQ